MENPNYDISFYEQLYRASCETSDNSQSSSSKQSIVNYLRSDKIKNKKSGSWPRSITKPVVDAEMKVMESCVKELLLKNVSEAFPEETKLYQDPGKQDRIDSCIKRCEKFFEDKDYKSSLLFDASQIRKAVLDIFVDKNSTQSSSSVKVPVSTDASMSFEQPSNASAYSDFSNSSKGKATVSDDEDAADKVVVQSISSSSGQIPASTNTSISSDKIESYVTEHSIRPSKQEKHFTIESGTITYVKTLTYVLTPPCKDVTDTFVGVSGSDVDDSVAIFLQS